MFLPDMFVTLLLCCVFFLIEMWQLRVRAVLDDEGEEDELLPVAPWV
jgi:hypothetical protein